MPEGLAWPPRKQDLERLYLVGKLSASKIASAYGLRYKNPKVAESTVLYHLKRNGIARRDRAEHIRTVTPEMVNEWVRRYVAGESLSQIAAASVSPVTVWLHIKKHGVQPRDKVEAQIKATTKYQRKPFTGDAVEKAYLVGLRYGDFHVVRHGRAIRVRVSTTHPAMATLFESLFSPFGYVHRYPRKAELVGYEWTLECDLEESFVFLLDRPSIFELEKMDERLFIAFLAGLFDAEGSVFLHKKGKRHNPEVAMKNTDRPLVDFVFVKLRRMGFAAHEKWELQQEDRDGIVGRSLIGRLSVWKFREVQEFLRLVPLRHREKTRRAELVRELEYGSSDSDQPELFRNWIESKQSMRAERQQFIEAARRAVEGKQPRSVPLAAKEEESDAFDQEQAKSS